PRMPPHELDDADAVPGRLGLGMGGEDRPLSLFDGGGEAEAAVHPGDVVVDRLGDADHGEVEPPPRDLADEGRGPPQRAVAADGKEDLDAVPYQGVDHVADVLRAARGAEDRPPLLVDSLDRGGAERQRLLWAGRAQHPGAAPVA